MCCCLPSGLTFRSPRKIWGLFSFRLHAAYLGYLINSVRSTLLSQSATFKTEQAAENAMEGRKKYIEAMNDLVHDVFSHEGDLDFAYMHEDFLSAKILQRNF